MENSCIFRIIDANINRLREALRVLEEGYRLINENAELASELKLIRHSLKKLESEFVPARLLEHRNTAGDPFANNNRPEEMERDGIGSVMIANLKRAQEAARVIEEYSKITSHSYCSAFSKEIRFKLYNFEKRLMESVPNG